MASCPARGLRYDRASRSDFWARDPFHTEGGRVGGPAAHEHDRATRSRAQQSCPSDQSAPTVSVVIPCLNEEATIEQCVRSALAVLRRQRHHRRDRSWPTTTPRTPAPGSPRPRARSSSTSPSAATGAPTWPGSPVARGRYIMMADADLTYDFDGDTPLPGRARGRRRHGDRQPDEEHPSGGDAVASPLHRQPAAVGLSEHAVPDRSRRRPLRDAGAAQASVLPAAGPAHHRDGVRLRNGDPRRQGEARYPSVPDRVPPARGRVEALELPGRLAPPAVPARPLAQPPVHLPGRA